METAPDIIAPQSRDLTKKTVQTGGGQYHNQEIHDHGHKTLAIIALVVACIAFGMVAMYVILAAQIIDAKIAAGTAQAQATARTAETHARVALDKVEDFRTKLAAKGIDVPPLDGH